MKKKMAQKGIEGFTLIEITIVIVLIALIGIIATISLVGRKNNGDLSNTTEEVGALLREAQSDSVSQSQGAQWGVHFDDTNTATPFYALFYTTSTYASGTLYGEYALLPDICYVTSTVGQNTSTDVIFSGVSGAPTTGTSTVITLQLGGCTAGNSITTLSSTITVGAAGAISY